MRSPLIRSAGHEVIQLHELELREIRLPLVEAFRSTSGTVSERRILLLELRDADGSVAWSECVAQATAAYAPETVDSCWKTIPDLVARRVLGESFRSPVELDAALTRVAREQPMARAAIEMGVWALHATQRALSLAALLAESSAVAKKDATPRDLVDTGIAIGMATSVEELIARVRSAVEAGYRRIKLKIEPGRDVEVVRAVREALGDEVPLSVDANCSYSVADSSHVDALLALDRLGVGTIEQPLDRNDLPGHAELQPRLQAAVCLDETITDAARTREAAAMKCMRSVNIKPGRVGGLREAIAIHDACAEAGIPVWCGGMLECGIGRAYNVALASLPGFTEPGDLSPSARYWTRDVVKPEWTMDLEGRVRVPLDKTGIGVEVDVDMIDDLTVRSEVLRAP